MKQDKISETEAKFILAMEKQMTPNEVYIKFSNEYSTQHIFQKIIRPLYFRGLLTKIILNKINVAYKSTPEAIKLAKGLK